MIYDVGGNQLSASFDCDGTAIEAAFDVDGEQVYQDTILLTYMTYNVMWWSGINAQQTMQNAIISKYEPDIIGFQEFCTGGNIPTVAATALADYPYIRLTNHKNYNAVASKLAIEDWTIADYQTQDPYDVEIYKETRCYMRGYLPIGSKRIAIFNTHLCVRTQAPRHAQAAELFALAQQEEYCIITGDFNSTDAPLTENSPDYINIYKPFVDAGYNLANNCPLRGFTNTHYSGSTHIDSLSDLTAALDNIIVSGNIDITDVIFDDTKLDYQTGTKFDHIPVVVNLEID